MAEPPRQLAYAAPQTELSAAQEFQEMRLRRRGIVLQSLMGLVHFLFLTLVAGVIVGVIVGPLFYLFGEIVGFPVWIVAIVMFPVLAFTMRRVRRRRAAAVVAYVQQAVRLNQPLNRILEAAARSEKGRVSQRLTRLRMALEVAAPLSVALSRAVPETPPRVIGLIQYAERFGRLPQTLDYIVREEVDASIGGRTNYAYARWYLPMMLLICIGVVSLICTFVLPKYREIFRSFHTPLPAVTQWLWSNSVTIDDWPVLAALDLVLLFMCGIQLPAIFTARGRSTVLARSISDRIRWFTPFVHRQQRDHALADVCRAAGDSISLGHTLHSAVLEASQLEMNFVMQDQVRAWAEGIGLGLSADVAARQARLPEFLAGMLATAKTTENMSEVFAFLARYYGSRFDRRAALLQGIIIPAVTFAMGAAVCAVALALLEPLTRLVETLTGK